MALKDWKPVSNKKTNDTWKHVNGHWRIDINQINPLTGTLQSVGVPTDEIWGRLDRAAEDNEWSDLDDTYKQAQKMSTPIIQSLHKKIATYFEVK